MYKIDIVFIIVSVLALVIVVGYSRPLVIAPLNDYESYDTNVLFSIKNAERIFIDDNLGFTTPEEYYVKDGLRVSLVPGIYYWKAVGFFGSDVRTLTINSVVDLELKEDGDNYNVINVGNVDLSVDVYDGDELSDRVKLKVYDNFDSSGDMFIGGQYE